MIPSKGKYICFDFETTQYGTVGKKSKGGVKFKSSPHSPRNWVAYVGYLTPETGLVMSPTLSTMKESKDYVVRVEGSLLGWTICAHNIKFDLAYARRLGIKVTNGVTTISFHQFYEQNFLWDTMVVEYLLAGQAEEMRMPSLDTVAPMYGGVLKDDLIKDYFNEGISSENINPEELYPYLQGDVENVEKIYLGQYDKVKLYRLERVVHIQMEFMKCTLEMECNGINLDLNIANQVYEKYEELLTNVTHDLRKELRAVAGDVPEEVIKETSPNFLSSLIFGGTVKNKERKPILNDQGQPSVNRTGKNKGRIKTKLYDVEYLLPGMGVTPEPHWYTKTGVSTGDKVLEYLAANNGHELFALLREHRRLSKLIGTYLRNETTCNATPQLVEEDGFIHHELNHAATVTGRLSGTNPNMQNIPKDKELRGMFTSRFGEDGVIVEIDYSQIEVWARAWRSGDAQLIQDLRSGVDMHLKRLSFASEAFLGRPYVYEELYRLKEEGSEEVDEARTKAKEITFQANYGAGAPSISATTGIPITEVKLFLAADDKAYPGVKPMHQATQRQVEQNITMGTHRVSLKDEDNNIIKNVSANSGMFITATGRRLMFKEGQKFRTKKLSFKPTEIKNYPDQAFAGGDMVPVGITKAYQLLKKKRFFNNSVVLINTIHDSVMFDMKKSVVDQAVPALCKCLEAVPQILQRKYNVAFDLVSPVDAEVGINWGAKQKYKFK